MIDDDFDPQAIVDRLVGAGRNGDQQHDVSPMDIDAVHVAGVSPELVEEAAAEWRLTSAAHVHGAQGSIHIAAPAGTETFKPAYHSGLVSLTGAELLKKQFPPREMLMAPWLPSKGLAMIFAGRGVGKTWVALNIAHAICGGGDFLGWKANRPRKIVYLDGEMPAGALQERYAAIVAAASFNAPDDHFRLVASDLQPDGLPDLGDPSAQRFYEDVIADADLIVVDNLSTICRSAKENESDSWAPAQSWCLRQRAKGKSVLLIHHAGKNGGQRGTSRREDVLDSVVNLTRPPDYDAADGARFEVRFTKARGFWGQDAEPFEARLVDGKWQRSTIASGDDADTVRAMKAAGLSVREIGERTGLSKSSVGRLVKGGNE